MSKRGGRQYKGMKPLEKRKSRGQRTADALAQGLRLVSHTLLLDS